MRGTPQHEVKAPRTQRGRPTRGQAASRDKIEVFPVVGIGASAGGLESCSRLLDALPADDDMAFILIQHLEPTHDSMMVELLASHTKMTVRQAADGMLVEPNHVYVIGPGTYLAVNDGVLRVSEPIARHGARLPFDFLLQSLATEYGKRAICIVLSGTGADGSLGLKAVKENDGFVIVQDPNEAAYDGMPKSAINTGLVDLVRPIAEIPGALAASAQTGTTHEPALVPGAGASKNWLHEIVELLRTNTVHDFRLYKQGTLQRRIERRMALSAITAGDFARYLEVLQSNANELDLLAKDLLINVTSFFRDPKVFDYLENTVIPDMVRKHDLHVPLRIWVAGCSTGEEAYSLAMVFIEQIAKSKRNIKLQVFASDIDADAIATARNGSYPKAIKQHVSGKRLARFFSREDDGYRISPEIRAIVVFTIQDVLTDPPFSRLDLVSCRNILIYLGPEAQVKVISLFHFALLDGGILLLGNAETVGQIAGRFDVISKPERLYRRAGRSRVSEIAFPVAPGNVSRENPRQTQVQSQQAILAELCRRTILENYAPAAVLINRRHECIYSLGPTERYLRVPSGQPTHDLLAMTHHGLHTKLRSAIQKAGQDNTRVLVEGCRMSIGGISQLFSIDVRPVRTGAEDLLLVCFIDEPKRPLQEMRPLLDGNNSRVTELERELDITRTELHGVIRDLEISGEEQKIISEEALSFNEEYQSTNEELLTSKEELQSLNEELTALNSQLQETLERQRTTSNDLQNVLYSTDVATIFLDIRLNIRFFTPATRSLFNVIAGDIGRPLADLHSLAADTDLLKDAHTVLKSQAPREAEINAESGAWYIRRILPYRSQNDEVEGVVITFADITERKLAADALEAAKRQAELANVAKSRFLAAASHDLRQPLQTLTLLHGLLANTVESEKSKKLVDRFDATLGAMSGMLNTLLDINQIEAGTIRTNITRFPMNELLGRLANEFNYVAQAKGLILRVVATSVVIETDPRLLEQMVRNLLSNALKYTSAGKVLLGCRRRQGSLIIEIWDTGIGIPEHEQQAIFEEYHQIDNSARQRSHGLGLGLAIVHRLGILLSHRIRLNSKPGRGSVFSIEIKLAARSALLQIESGEDVVDAVMAVDPATGTIMVVEDDPELRDLLETLFKDQGYKVFTAPDGPSAVDAVIRHTGRLDLILADFNLPNGMDGLQIADKLREHLNRQVPVIILTGDISTATLKDISRHDCIHLNKPVKVNEMVQTIRDLISGARNTKTASKLYSKTVDGSSGKPMTFVVDDDSYFRQGICDVLESDGQRVEAFASCEAFLEAYRPGQEACLLVDAYLPGMSGIELLQRLSDKEYRLPSIMITGNSDVSMAVDAMKAGASDFIEKPVGSDELLATVARALEQSRDENKRSAWHDEAAEHILGLTLRQKQIMELVLAGHPSKNIAADLGISQRTVENHRASIMKKTGSKSLPALARLVLVAAGNNTGQPANGLASGAKTQV